MRHARSQWPCVLLMSALAATACGRKNIKTPGTALTMPAPPTSSRADVAPAPERRDHDARVARDDRPRRAARPEAPAPTDLLGSNTRHTPEPVGTSSVVITQTPTAAPQTGSESGA